MMPQNKFHELPHIADDIDYLLKNDDRIKAFDIDPSAFDWIKKDDGFETLLRTIVGQQLSLKAAATIWERVRQALNNNILPEKVLGTDDNVLRAAGLSQQKVNYVNALATAVLEKQLSFETFPDMDDDDIIKAITAVKGFGVWSAQMYLMFSMARPNVWPAGDLGIQKGIQIYFDLPERPKEKVAKNYMNHFAPRNTAASLIMWTIQK